MKAVIHSALDAPLPSTSPSLSLLASDGSPACGAAVVVRLAPTPHRGKTNSPAYVPLVARQLAELKGLEVEEVGRITSENFAQLFSRVQA